MNNMMIDLETMGTPANAAIVAIGAVKFDIQSRTVTDRFYAAVDLQSSIDAGGVVDASTLIWWVNQSDDAKKSTFDNPTYINDALFSFTCWIGENPIVWGNGAAFDNVILRSAYERLKFIVPWDYWNDRCYRTVKALYPDVPFERVGTRHNAVNDAESQAIHLMRMLNP